MENHSPLLCGTFASYQEPLMPAHSTQAGAVGAAVVSEWLLALLLGVASLAGMAVPRRVAAARAPTQAVGPVWAHQAQLLW